MMMTSSYYAPFEHGHPKSATSLSRRHGSRRRLFGYLIATIVLCLLVYRKSPSLKQQTNLLYETNLVPPLLGSQEDHTKLWFPPPFAAGYSNYTPQVAPHNAVLRRPANYRPPRTPLFIAFTRNNDMLIQAVLSYIAAGWPRSDIIVVDNSGTMDANLRNDLTKANPFFLDYNILRSRYGVSILQTPTYLSFAQLQNFFLRTAMAHGWPYFFWSHMDIAVLSDERRKPYRSFYGGVIDLLAELGYHNADTPTLFLRRDWAVKFFMFDWLTLVNVEAWRTIGAWDTFIPFYATDCDAYFRLAMHGFTADEVRAGNIYDMSLALKNPEARFFPKSKNETLNSFRYQKLQEDLKDISDLKQEGDRNEWQAKNGGRALTGGKGEAWTYNPQAFDLMWWLTAAHGRSVFVKKWGTTWCAPQRENVTLRDEYASLFDENGVQLTDFHVP